MLDITREMGEATLSSEERVLWEALACADLEVDMTAKISKELRKLRGRKKPPSGTSSKELEARAATASRLMYPLLDALHPEVVNALFQDLMAVRVERDLLLKAASDLLSAQMDDEDDEDDEDDDEDDEDDEEEGGLSFAEASLRLAHLIEDIRERHG